MRYLPKSPAERKQMLAVVGGKSIDELFSSVPEQYRLKKALNLPGPAFRSGDHSIFQGPRR